jgi:hypothetical protein
MSVFKKVIFASLALFSVMGTANASIITYNFGAPQAGAPLETFDELPLGSINTTLSLPVLNSQLTLNNAQIVQGSITNVYAAPYLDTTQYIAVYGGGSAVFSLSQPADYFGIEWGSVDPYNSLTFFNGNTVIGTISGQSIITAANLPPESQYNGNGTVYANFTSTEAFTKVVASSTANSFEFDNVRVGNVPLPASLPMFAAVLMGFGVWVSRCNKKRAAKA